MKLISGILGIAILALVSCSEHPRPNITQAKADFRRLCPETEIIEVRISEDEVIARSFEFTYRKKGEEKEKKTEIQYVKFDSGAYEIAPEPPKELP